MRHPLKRPVESGILYQRWMGTEDFDGHGGQGVYRNMDEWLDIRRRVLKQGVSKRQILRETGLHWKTLNKILSESAPPGYRRKAPYRQPKIGPYRARIEEILEQDKELP